MYIKLLADEQYRIRESLLIDYIANKYRLTDSEKSEMSKNVKLTISEFTDKETI